VKFEGLVIVIPLTVILTGPEVAPGGTDVVMLVEVDAVTMAEIPLKLTKLLAGVVLKLVPEIITVALSAPVVGLNPVIEGVGDTVKLLALKMVMPLRLNEILPEVAPTGTVVVILVAVEAVTIAATPLKCKILSAGIVLKSDPVIIIAAPTAPFAGLKPVIDGEG